MSRASSMLVCLALLAAPHDRADAQAPFACNLLTSAEVETAAG